MINPDHPVDEIETLFFNYLSERIGDFTVTEHLEAMTGGNEAYLYRFRISGIENYDSRLVLRLFPSYVPKVYLTTSDTSILGGSFLVMDYVEGEAIDPGDDPSVLVLTAKTQAMLHLKEGKKISEKIIAQGHSAGSHNYDGRINWLVNHAEEYPSIGAAVKWLIENRPDEPETPSVIHGDFHPMNLLVKDGEVNAILDWSGFMVGDPMYGLGWTKALFIATGKHELPEDVFNQLVQMYIDAYESIHPIDYAKMDYYVVFRLVRALLEGKEGQEVWTRPYIVKNIVKEIKEMTGILVQI